jgi:hypothetical protein
LDLSPAAACRTDSRPPNAAADNTMFEKLDELTPIILVDWLAALVALGFSQSKVIKKGCSHFPLRYNDCRQHILSKFH